MIEAGQGPLPALPDRPAFPGDAAEPLEARGSRIPKPPVRIRNGALENERLTCQERQAQVGQDGAAKERTGGALPLPARMTPEDGTSPPDPQLSDPILTVKELADFLRLDHKTVREAIERGEIPGVRRIGATIRIYRDAVIKWLSSGQGRVSRSRRIR
jgi:excisionase family DNA binding protein